MKLEQILEEQFKKLVPYKPLTAPEIEAIKEGVITFLSQEQEIYNYENLEPYEVIHELKEKIKNE